jgi:hypothetical protein
MQDLNVPAASERLHFSRTHASDGPDQQRFVSASTSSKPIAERAVRVRVQFDISALFANEY